MAYLIGNVYTSYTQAIHKIHLEANLNKIRCSGRNYTNFPSWPWRCGY